MSIEVCDKTSRSAVIPSGDDAYAEALVRERRRFENCLDVHDLPQIFHYWSQRYLRPRLLPFGFESPNAMFARYLAAECAKGGCREKRFVSLGSGNCDLEIALARDLRGRGHESFVIDCIDLNAAMLERGRVAATAAGVSDRLEFVQSDINGWAPVRQYDAAITNQFLHHVVNLEGLFAQIKRSLRPGGLFIISDMIGRNGHQRWPEALDLVHDFWRRLPPSYRFNLKSGRYEEMFRDWDCSAEEFEGIRSQDILPLLLREFEFQFFLPFGNIIDPFVDRSFGHHFDATAAWDRAFIDEVHRRDEAGLSSGLLTPTHMLAVVGTDLRVDPILPVSLSPKLCVRIPGNRKSGISSLAHRRYDPLSWPHPPTRELEIICERLARDEGVASELQSELHARTAWALRIESEMAERTAWALRLQSELDEGTAWALRLQSQLDERTAWALRLESERDEGTAWALRLQSQLDERTAWARELCREVEAGQEAAARAGEQVTRLEAEIQAHFRHPIRFLFLFAVSACKRVRDMALHRGPTDGIPVKTDESPIG